MAKSVGRRTKLGGRFRLDDLIGSGGMSSVYATVPANSLGSVLSLALCATGWFLHWFDTGPAHVLFIVGGLGLLVHGGFMLVTNRGLSDRALMSSRVCGGGMTTFGLAACSGGVGLMDPDGPWLLGLAPLGLALLATGVATARFASKLTRHAEEYGWTSTPR